MSVAEYIDLSSDDETEATDIRDVKPCLLPSLEYTRNRFANNEAPLGEHFIKHEEQLHDNLNFPNGVPNGSLLTSQVRSHSNGFCSVSGTHGPSVPLCRQFWKSGDYEHGQAVGRISRNGQNRLRIHPKFLHSNATSHKWAFGAIAELLDNAVDEVQKGATFVSVDKFTNPRNGDPALLIQDDGGGMDPESLRRCMSFGFSDKQSDSTIGQYGNGFKTSSMRLGADAIVFTRCMNRRVLTQSVGILSYTFLQQTGSDDIVVPMVDYEFDTLTGTFRRLLRQDEKQFNSNLFALCKWSPFISEVDLLKQFNDMEHHGTKIVVFNLWFNDNGDMELDFESDQKDIIINGSQGKVKKLENNLTQRYISNRLQYSLRAYTSVLYLRLPKNFKVILRGEVVQPHQIAKDLRYIACILYKPQVGGTVEGEVVTTIGYLEGCPNINVHGFNIYYKNRLILPFWRVANNSYGKGKGVVGVLETNFIKPTHDKQDFEKSTLFQKLESRLKEMTYEYWDYHCHLVGYTHSKHPSAKIPTADKVPRITRNGKVKVRMNLGAAASTKALEAQLRSSSRLSIGNQLLPALSDPTYQAPSHSIYNAGSQTGLSPQKRKYEMVHVSEMEPLEQALTVRNSDELDTRRYSSLERNVGEKQASDTRAMIQENKKLQQQCLEYEESEKKLLLKAEEVRSELLKAQLDYKKLLEELESMNEVKVEK